MRPVAVRAVVADADQLSRNLVRIACRSAGVRVVGEARTTAEAVALCRAESPDVAVVAGGLPIALAPKPGPNGERIAGDCRPGVPGDPPEVGFVACLDEILAAGAGVVVLSEDAAPDRVADLFERGVRGYLLRDAPPAQVAEAVLAVAGGAAALSPLVAATLLDQWRWLRSRQRARAEAAGSALTPRERDVLAAMAEGLATKAIARRLGIAVKTVENHKIRVFDKLGARSQAHAVSLAIGRGLVAAPPGGTAAPGDGPH